MLLLPPPLFKEDVPDSIWLEVFLFFLLWWTLYWALLRILQREAEYCCRLITLIHGIVVVGLTLRDIILTKQQFDFYCKTPLSAYLLYILMFSISYFLYDLLWMLIFGNESLTMKLHHLFSIFLITVVVWNDSGGAGISYGLFGLEFTNPYLQIRWFLRTHGQFHRPIHTVLELWFIATFVIIRIFGGTFLLYFVLNHPNLNISLKISFIGIYVMSLLLVLQIIIFFYKKYVHGHQNLLTGSVLSLFRNPRRVRFQASPPPELDATEVTDRGS